MRKQNVVELTETERAENEAPCRQRRGINSLKLGCAASRGELTPLRIRKFLATYVARNFF